MKMWISLIFLTETRSKRKCLYEATLSLTLILISLSWESVDHINQKRLTIYYYWLILCHSDWFGKMFGCPMAKSLFLRLLRREARCANVVFLGFELLMHYYNVLPFNWENWPALNGRSSGCVYHGCFWPDCCNNYDVKLVDTTGVRDLNRRNIHVNIPSQGTLVTFTVND